MLSQAKFKCNIGECDQFNEYLQAIDHMSLCDYLAAPCILGCNELVFPRLMELHSLEKCPNTKF